MVRSLLRGATHRVAASVDRAFAAAALNPPRVLRLRSSAEALGHTERMEGLSAIEAFYSQAEHIDRPDSFFPAAPRIQPEVKRARRYGVHGEVLDLSWPSEFEPLWDPELAMARAAPGSQHLIAGASARIDRSRSLRDKYLAAEENRTAHARWFRHTGSAPRPCALLLHGYLTGNFAFEERVFPVQDLFAAGMDVVLSVLPFHGLRRDSRRGLMPPAFPSSDPRFTIEGFRQLVRDQRALIDYLLDGRVNELGVMGMSLGGYGAALLATLDERLAFCVPYVPLAAIEQFAEDNGRMVGELEQRAAQAEALRRAQWPVSPLARPSRVPPERVVVIGARADRVTGTKHSARLAEHFGCAHVVFEGGHLLQVGRAQALVPVFDMLRGAGLMG